MTMPIVTKLHLRFAILVRCEFTLFCWVLYDLRGYIAEYYVTL